VAVCVCVCSWCACAQCEKTRCAARKAKGLGSDDEDPCSGCKSGLVDETPHGQRKGDRRRDGSGQRMGVISTLLVTVFSPAAAGELQHAKGFW